MSPDTATSGTPRTCGSNRSAVLAQLADLAALALDQIPLVDRDHQRAALALDQIGDAQILLLEAVLRIHHQHHHFGKADGAQGIGDRQLLQLLLDTRAAAQACGVEHAKRAALPDDVDGDGIPRRAGLRAGQKPLLAEQLIDQRRLAGVGPADDGNADRPRLGVACLRRVGLSSSVSSQGPA